MTINNILVTTVLPYFLKISLIFLACAITLHLLIIRPLGRTLQKKAEAAAKDNAAVITTAKETISQFSKWGYVAGW